MTTAPKPGNFCWAELGTTDPEGAKVFYNKLFGWNPVDAPMGEEMVYTNYRIGGKAVAGSYGLMPDQRAQGVPSNWQLYVAVADADASTACAKELGATVIMGPMDVDNHGRMTILQDPTGAVLGLWQARDHVGFQAENEPGTHCWSELVTTDLAKAREFYPALFGWTTQASQASSAYIEFVNDGRPIAGMTQMPPNMAGVPPHWLGYFTVEDCDSTVNLATSLGAAPLVPPTDIPKVGRFSVLRDPQGAVFYVIRLTMAASA